MQTFQNNQLVDFDVGLSFYFVNTLISIDYQCNCFVFSSMNAITNDTSSDMQVTALV